MPRPVPWAGEQRAVRGDMPRDAPHERSDMEDSGPEFEVVWPLAKWEPNAVAPVLPIGTLDGKRIAFIWDYRFKGDEMFAMVRDDLLAQYPGVEFVEHAEFGNVHGAEEAEVMRALPERLQRLRIDGAVVGVGA